MYYIKNDSFQTYNAAIEEFNKQCHNGAIMMQRTKGSRIVDIVAYLGYSFSYKAFFNDTSSPLRKYFNENMGQIDFVGYYEIFYKNGKREITEDFNYVKHCLSSHSIDSVALSNKHNDMMVASYIVTSKCVTSEINTKYVSLFSLLREV